MLTRTTATRTHRATHRALLVIGVLPTTMLTGCITSPTGSLKASLEAREMQLDPCPGGLIEDAEDNNSQILKNEERGGYWFTFVDEAGSTIEPHGEFTMSPGGPPGSQYAAHVKGQMAGSGASIYAGFGFAIADPKAPYDASKYKGVSFWAKGPGTVRFKTPDINTDPQGDRCNDCYNDFGVDIYLSEEWTRYTVPFSKMKQQSGWGDPAPAVATDGLFAIQWQYGQPDSAFDLWVDNIEFVGCWSAAEATP